MVKTSGVICYSAEEFDIRLDFENGGYYFTSMQLQFYKGEEDVYQRHAKLDEYQLRELQYAQLHHAEDFRLAWGGQWIPAWIHDDNLVVDLGGLL